MDFLTFLVDAVNWFNNSSCKAMMLIVAHRWPAGAWFVFNMYRHSLVLILHQRGEETLLILSREGVTQGDPLAMVLYEGI